MKDHERALFVNELRDTAVKYKDCQSLREALSKVVQKYVPKEDKENYLQKNLSILVTELCDVAVAARHKDFTYVRNTIRRAVLKYSKVDIGYSELSDLVSDLLGAILRTEYKEYPYLRKVIEEVVVNHLPEYKKAENT